jgi:hypothetical protein
MSKEPPPTPTRLRWFAMADWCKKNGLSPYVSENWKAAGNAVDEETKKELTQEWHANGLETLCSLESFISSRMPWVGK